MWSNGQRSGGRGFKSHLTTKLELFLGTPLLNSSVMLVNNQLVCLQAVGNLSLLWLADVCFVQFKWYACELQAMCS